jgi:hypothetical protein
MFDDGAITGMRDRRIAQQQPKQNKTKPNQTKTVACGPLSLIPTSSLFTLVNNNPVLSGSAPHSSVPVCFPVSRVLLLLSPDAVPTNERRTTQQNENEGTQVHWRAANQHPPAHHPLDACYNSVVDQPQLS